MKRKVIKTTRIIFVTLLFIYILASLNNRDQLANSITGFYSELINEDYINIYKRFSTSLDPNTSIDVKMSRTAQQLISDRYMYGKITGYDTKIILWTGLGKRFVIVKVENTDDNKKRYYDKINFKKINNQWYVNSYMSGSPNRLP